MTQSTPTWLRLLPLGLFLLLLAGAAGASLTVIHLRQEVGHLAASCTKLGSDVGEAGRRLEEMTATVAAAEQPDTLLRRIGTRLAPITEKQTVWVRPGSSPASFETRTASAPALPSRFAAIEPFTKPGLTR